MRAWFNIQDFEQHVEDGRAIIEREFKRLNAHDISIEKLARKLGYDKQQEMYAAIGRNTVTTAQIDAAIYNLEFPEKSLPPMQAPRRSRAQDNNDEISVRGVGSLLTQISKCCKPVPYDPIVGYITRGKGVSVHRFDCANILKLREEDRERLIEVEWGSERKNVYPVDLQILAYDRQGLLHDVSRVMKDLDLNVIAVNTSSDNRDQTARMQLTVEFPDVQMLTRVMDRLRQLHNVLEVERRN